MKKKIAEIRRYMKTAIPCASIQPQLHALSVESMDIHVIRSTVAHGFCQPNGPHKGDKYEFGISDQKNGFMYATRFFSLAELDTAAARMVEIGYEVNELHEPVRGQLYRTQGTQSVSA